MDTRGGDRGRKSEPLEERFWRQVRKIPGGCWEWTGPVRNNGYGQLTVGSRRDGTRRVVTAYQLALELKGIVVPEGYEPDHRCENRLCVRYHKRHIQIVTVAENRGRNNRNKTHCPKGHPYNEENVLAKKRGRDCRICHRDRERKRAAARRAARKGE